MLIHVSHLRVRPRPLGLAAALVEKTMILVKSLMYVTPTCYTKAIITTVKCVIAQTSDNINFLSKCNYSYCYVKAFHGNRKIVKLIKHRHLSKYRLLNACLVYFSSSVNGRSKRKRKRK